MSCRWYIRNSSKTLPWLSQWKWLTFLGQVCYSNAFKYTVHFIMRNTCCVLLPYILLLTVYQCPYTKLRGGAMPSPTIIFTAVVFSQALLQSQVVKLRRNASKHVFFSSFLLLTHPNVKPVIGTMLIRFFWVNNLGYFVVI